MRKYAGLWDWIYNHHAGLSIAAAVLVGLELLILGYVALRQPRPLALLGAVVPVAVVAVILAGWVVADRRSNDRDISRRVAQVSGALPGEAHQTGATAEENFRSVTYVVSGDPATTAAVVRTAVSRFLPAGENFGSARGGPDSPFVVDFGGRNGCDGLVEVEVTTSPSAARDTQVGVDGHCED